MRWDLKEAGGKALVRQTEIRYEANVRDEKAKIFKVRNLSGTHGRISGGHKCGGRCALPGEISGFAIKLAPLQGGDDEVGEVSRDHSRSLATEGSNMKTRSETENADERWRARTEG